ncbi:acyltransferase [Occultella glacieicola]|uniref:Acyltransferase n=1 Tax=Occultella glacieicola TaxID=2518684 RepID=A0ABY2E0E9_9MICO|nr:acyltransferase [Occultella glacieicola]TDE90885.1 acyltransferase [Occultella glacieicola]
MTATLDPPVLAPAASPPPARDLFVDVLRLFAIVLVVAQHWLMPVFDYSGGTLVTGNALTVPGGWAITWISQVMPLIFFTGGAATAISLRRRGTGPDRAWVAERILRLAIPVLALAALWLPLPHLLLALGLPAEPVSVGARLVGALLWFLAAYVMITLLSPALVRLAQVLRGRELVGFAAVAIAVDVARFSFDAPDLLGYLNVLAVWGAVHQAGIHYGNGRLRGIRGVRALALGVAGFAVAALAVAFGPYPPSMIGLPGDPMSNMNPPTAVLLALAVGQLGLALAIREKIAAWAARPRVAAVVGRLSGSSMTVYLWHTPALVLVAGVAVFALDRGTPDPLSAEWFDGVTAWVAMLTVVLVVAVRVFSRLERVRLPRPVAADLSAGRLGAGGLLVGLGVLALTVGGFRPETFWAPTGPLVAVASITVGVLLLSGGRVRNAFAGGSGGRDGQPRWSSAARTGRVAS